jgi:hypothetical protein
MENLTEIEKAQQLIDAEIKRVDEICSNEINEVLKKHSRQLVVNGQFQGDKIQTSISLVKTS